MYVTYYKYNVVNYLQILFLLHKSVAVIRGTGITLPCNIYISLNVAQDSLCAGHRLAYTEHQRVFCMNPM